MREKISNIFLIKMGLKINLDNVNTYDLSAINI